MSNFKVDINTKSDSDIREIDGRVVSEGGTSATTKYLDLVTSGQLVSVSGHLQAEIDSIPPSSGSHSHPNLTELNQVSGTNTGNQVTSTLPNDSAIPGGSASDALNYLQLEIANIQASNISNVKNKIEELYTTTPDVILTSSGAGDLAIAISGLTDKQVLEIRSSAVFSPIIVPSGVQFSVKVADGYLPVITGQECIRLSNGAANLIFSGLIIENCTTSYGNGRGSAIAMVDTHAIVQDIIFHNITIRNAPSSAVLISYYTSLSGDYATPATLAQMSSRISFVGCHLHKCVTDIIEGASLTLRGVNGAYVADCYVNSANLGRGMQFQNCINAVIENNYVNNCNDGNGGEGIKIDQLGATSGYRGTAIIRNNIIRRCIEGIDIDDDTSCNIIQNNIISECTEEGISLDGGIPNGIAAIIGNTCYKNGNGIRLESGAVANLKKNVCYNNTTTDYLIQNGYSLDDSNSTSLDDCFIYSYGKVIKNDSIVSGTTIADAVNTLDTTTQKISSGTSRPGTPAQGQMFFDTSLSPARPIWYIGTGWVDSTGTGV